MSSTCNLFPSSCSLVPVNSLDLLDAAYSTFDFPKTFLFVLYRLLCTRASLRHVCNAHLQAYEKSYRKYKDAADEAKTLHVQLKRSDVRSLDLVEVNARTFDVRAYIEALEKERELRREHDRLFVGEPDNGHRARLLRIEQQLTHNRDILHMLRSRQGRLKRDLPERSRQARRSTLPAQSVPPIQTVLAASSSRPAGRTGRRQKDEERSVQAKAAPRHRRSKERERQRSQEVSLQQIACVPADSEAGVRAGDTETPSMDNHALPKEGHNSEIGTQRGPGEEDGSTAVLQSDRAEKGQSLPSSQHIQQDSEGSADKETSYEQQVSTVRVMRDDCTVRPVRQCSCAALTAPMAPVAAVVRIGSALEDDVGAAKKHVLAIVEAPAATADVDRNAEAHSQQIVDELDIFDLGGWPDKAGETRTSTKQPAAARQDLVVVCAEGDKIEVTGIAPGPIPLMRSAQSESSKSQAPPVESQEPGNRDAVTSGRLSQGSIEAHITVDYGACAWNTDLERQDPEDDASKRGRAIRWKIVCRIACLVLTLLVARALAGKGALSRTLRILRDYARAAGRTLT